MTGIFFFLLQVSTNCREVVLKSRRVGFSHFANFIHYGIWFHGSPPPSSSGEQIMGLSYPDASIIVLIRAFISALLICRKCHVERKSIPCTVAREICSASSALDGGIVPSSIKRLPNCSAATLISRIGSPEMAAKRLWAASAPPALAPPPQALRRRDQTSLGRPPTILA
jgi:hypothetical protein